MNGPRTLLDAEDRWVTSLGAFIPAEGRVVMHGKDLHHDLGELGWMDLLAFAVTGRRFSRERLALFQGLWAIAVSYPEPRIWNNRVAALAASARSTAGMAVAGAVGVTDAGVYGQQPMQGVFELLTRAVEMRRAGEDVEPFVLSRLRARRSLPGYGRPLRDVDERLAPALALAKRLRLDGGPHLHAAQAIETFVRPHRLRMNIAALSAALYADQGVSRSEYYHLTALSFSIGFLACHHDASRHTEGTFMPLRCSRIAYQGPEPRPWTA